MAALKHSRQRESIKEYLKMNATHPTADTVLSLIHISEPTRPY